MDFTDLKKRPEYFYRVNEFVTTFRADKGKNDSFSHDKEFNSGDLLKDKEEATAYYWERLNGLERSGKYFLPFAAPKDFKLGENAAYSITLSLVEYYSSDSEIIHPLIGEDEETCKESKEIELNVLNNA